MTMPPVIGPLAASNRQRVGPDLSGLDLGMLPSLRSRLTESEDRDGPIAAGLKAGTQTFLGLGGAGLAAVGRATGLEGVERAGTEFADRRFARAAEVGRPDLEEAPWRNPDTPWLPFAAYQTARQIPQMAAALGAALIPGALPARIAAAGLVQLPQAAGSMYQEARDRGDPTREDAVKALALSPIYAGLDAVLPGTVGAALRGTKLPGVVGKAMASPSLVTRVATAGTLGAVSEVPQEAAQTAMELSFRPDIAPAEKMRQIVDAGLIGGFVGGIFGGMGGVRRAKHVKPGDYLNDPDALAQVVDEELGTAPTTAKPPVRPPDPTGQEDLFPNLPDVEPPVASALVSDRPDPVAPVDAPVAGQADLFPEELERIEGRRTVQTFVSQVVPKPTPFTEQLQAASPEELVLAVEDRLRKGGATKDVQRLGTALGLVQPNGKWRNLAGEIADLQQGVAGQDPATAQQQIAVRQAQLEIIERARALRPAPVSAAPAPQAPPAAAPPTITDVAPDAALEPAALRDMLARAARRRTQFTTKLDAATPIEAAAKVREQLEAGKSSTSLLQLAEAFGFFGADGQPIDFPARIAEQQAAVEAATPETRAAAEQALARTQWQAQVQQAITPPLTQENTDVAADAARDAEVTEEGRREEVVEGAAVPAEESRREEGGDGLLPGQDVQDLEVRAAVPAEESRREEGGQEVGVEEGPARVPDEEVAEAPAEVPAAPAPTRRASNDRTAQTKNPQQGVMARMGLTAEQQRAQDLETFRAGATAEASREQIEQAADAYKRMVADAAQSTAKVSVRKAKDGTYRVFVGSRRVFEAAKEASANSFAQDVGIARGEVVRDGYGGVTPAPEAAPAPAPEAAPAPAPEAAPAPAPASEPTAEKPKPKPKPKRVRRTQDEIKAAGAQTLSDADLATQRDEKRALLKAATAWRQVGRDIQAAMVTRRVAAQGDASTGRGTFGRIDSAVGEERARVMQVLRKYGIQARPVAEIQANIERAAALAEQLGDELEVIEGEIARRAGEAEYVTPGTSERAARATQAVPEPAQPARMLLQGDVVPYADVPAWLRGSLNEATTDVVYADADVALVRTHNVYDKAAAYRAFMRTASGVRWSKGDVSKYDGRDITADQLATLQAARREAELREAALAAQYPEGPFTGTSDRVVATEQVDTKYVQWLEQLLRSLGMHDARVFLSTRQDVQANSEEEQATAREAMRTKYNLYGPYFRALYPNVEIGHYASIGAPGHIQIVYDASLTQAQILEVIAHELGHHIRFSAFSMASAKVKNAIFAAHTAWRERVLTGPGSSSKGVARAEFARGLRPAALAEQQIASGKNPIIGPDSDSYSYMLSFDEWFADQVARWATTEAAPTSILEEFFSGVAEQIKKLVAAVTGKPYVAKEMQAFLDNMGPTDLYEAFLESTMGPTDAAGSNLRTMADGPVQQVLTNAKTVFQRAIRLNSALDTNDRISVGARTMALGWMSLGHIDTRYGDLFDLRDKDGRVVENGLHSYLRHEQERSTIAHMFAGMGSSLYHRWEKLHQADPKTTAILNDAMMQTERQIDPTKTWRQHTWLPELSGIPRDKKYGDLSPMQRRRIDEIGRANKLHLELQRRGALDLYLDMRALNDATLKAQMANELYYLIVSNEQNEELKAMLPEFFARDPMAGFLELENIRDDAQAASDYWGGVLDAQVRDIEQYLQGQAQEAKDAELTGEKFVTNRINPLLQEQLDRVAKQRQLLEAAPYFHLGRYGDHFLSFQLPPLPDGETMSDTTLAARDAQLTAIGQRFLDAGFDQVQITPTTDHSSAYLTFENSDQLNAAFELVKQLQTEGLLPAGRDMVKGRRTSADAPGIMRPQWIRTVLEQIDVSPAFKVDKDTMSPEEQRQLLQAKAAMIASARQLMLDMMPDISVTKVMMKREGRPGFARDMVQNYAHRIQMAGTALANLSASVKIAGDMTRMDVAVREAEGSDAVSPRQAITAATVRNEVRLRLLQRPLHAGRNFVDTWRAINHAWFLGFSPAYALVNTTQIGVLLWPELAKKHGFVRAAKAMAKVTPAMLKIMRATMAEGRKLGWTRAVDAIIDENALKASGVDAATAKFMRQMVHSGVLELGGPSRELGRVAEGSIDSRLDTTLRFAGAFGHYTETASRVLAALAARELSGEDGKATVDYAVRTVNESMLNYSQWFKARQMGRGGVLGQMSEVVFSFMTYQQQLLEKLYREFAVAITDKNVAPADRAAARRFLGSHLVAVTTLAGTLGLPMATVMAKVIESLTDLLDDDEEPFDVESAWRNFLAETFGKDVGEMLARGVIRGAGIDVARRIGEQDLLPFSGLLADSRPWQDASQAWAVQALGAPVSMLFGIAQGAERMAQGDVLGAMRTMVPTSIRGVSEAYRMTTEGYVDTRGNPLPITPKAREILSQAVGLAPARKAEYSEANLAQIQRRGALTQRASVLRSRLARAVEQQDREAFREAVREARQFDRANPTYGVLRSVGETIRRRARDRQQAQLTSLPLRTNLRDAGARNLTQFANF